MALLLGQKRETLGMINVGEDGNDDIYIYTHTHTHTFHESISVS